MGVFMLIFVSSYTIMTLNKVHMEFYFHFHVYTQYTNTFCYGPKLGEGLWQRKQNFQAPKQIPFK